jgi:hypothetical protein
MHCRELMRNGAIASFVVSGLLFAAYFGTRYAVVQVASAGARIDWRIRSGSQQEVETFVTSLEAPPRANDTVRSCHRLGRIRLYLTARGCFSLVRSCSGLCRESAQILHK